MDDIEITDIAYANECDSQFTVDFVYGSTTYCCNKIKGHGTKHVNASSAMRWDSKEEDIYHK